MVPYVAAQLYTRGRQPGFLRAGGRVSGFRPAVPVWELLRKPAWMASLCGLGGAAAVALGIYGMPPDTLVSAIGYGAAFGLFPIGWVVFTAILLYRITVETGKFEIVKDSVGNLTEDRRLQALLIAFAFGAFIEGAAGFGTPVAVAAAMLAGLGFAPFYAGGHLPAGQHRAGGVRLHRHSHHSRWPASPACRSTA